MIGPDLRQFLLIANDAELYGIGLPSVQEIRVYQPLTRLPNAPAYVAGILNVGGRILPVIDLRHRLWGHRTEPGPWHLIVVVKGEATQCGILVDAASEIIDFQQASIEEMSQQDKQASVFTGLAHLSNEAGEQSVAILDIDVIANFSFENRGFGQPHEEISYV